MIGTRVDSRENQGLKNEKRNITKYPYFPIILFFLKNYLPPPSYKIRTCLCPLYVLYLYQSNLT